MEGNHIRQNESKRTSTARQRGEHPQGRGQRVHSPLQRPHHRQTKPENIHHHGVV